MLLSSSLRIVDPCIGLVRVMRSSLMCSVGGRLWLFTAVRVTRILHITVTLHKPQDSITESPPASHSVRGKNKKLQEKIIGKPTVLRHVMTL
jgi:hypothetical protein